MDHINNLMTVLTILDTNWGKFSSDLTVEQLSNLKIKFSGLERKMNSVEDIEMINDLSQDFIQTFSSVEPLEFLSNIDKTQMRSGNLDELIEEIRIKIINYCVSMQNRINDMEIIKLPSDDIGQ